MAIKADIDALKDSVRARINDNEDQDITAADVRESVIDTIDTLHEETERDFQKKETGKGLSKNDYTDEDKEKVDGSIQKIIHNGVPLPVVDGTSRLDTVSSADVDAKINYAINNEARERQAMDSRFRQEIGNVNALETDAKQIVPAINEAIHKCDGYSKAEADALFATKEELADTRVLIPYIDENSTDDELIAVLDIFRNAHSSAVVLCEAEANTSRYVPVTDVIPIYRSVRFCYVFNGEYIRKGINMAPLKPGRRYECYVEVLPISGVQEAPEDGYAYERKDGEWIRLVSPTDDEIDALFSGKTNNPSQGASSKFVDLGLPSGLKWAKCNLGADKETDYGFYFGYDDAVYADMDAGSRVPTKDEIDELFGNTDHYVADINGVMGMKFVSMSDSSKYIFIPFAGSCINGTFYNERSAGYIWSSTAKDGGNAYMARCYEPASAYTDFSSRTDALSVRTVSE